MVPLFLFGTLRHRPLLEAVLHGCDHLTLVPAHLPDHAVHSVTEGPFPTIVARPGGRAEGLCVHGLKVGDYACLDFYEGAFDYRRTEVTLADGSRAQAYFPPAGRWSIGGDWSLDEWAAGWADLSIRAAREVMTYLGEKTSAEIGFMFPMIRARAWSQINAARSKHGAETLDGLVEVADRTRAYSHYFALDDYRLRHERFDGAMSKEVARAVFLAPDAALVLPYDPVRDRVLLVEQVRMGPLARGDRRQWQLEPIAGRLDPGEDPQTAARREALEEAGLQLGALEPVAEAYCSPGNSTEFYYIYVAVANLPDRAAGTGGLEVEHEDIRAHLVDFDRLMDMCSRMEVCNAPLVIAAYWLAHHRARLRAVAGQQTNI